MRRAIDRDEFGKLFDEFEHTAFRLETQERYVEDDEIEPLQAFLAGRPDYGWLADWVDYLREVRAAGKVFERVRVVNEPHSDYTRFGLDASRTNVAAGDDIRYLPRPLATRLGLPDEDYWLFDSRVAVIFQFGTDGRVRGYELVDDPETIVQRNVWRDIAKHYAIPRNEYAAAHNLA
jgi:hypothetical protein